MAVVERLRTPRRPRLHHFLSPAASLFSLPFLPFLPSLPSLPSPSPDHCSLCRCRSLPGFHGQCRPTHHCRGPFFWWGRSSWTWNFGNVPVARLPNRAIDDPPQRSTTSKAGVPSRWSWWSWLWSWLPVPVPRERQLQAFQWAGVPPLGVATPWWYRVDGGNNSWLVLAQAERVVERRAVGDLRRPSDCPIADEDLYLSLTFSMWCATNGNISVKCVFTSGVAVQNAKKKAIKRFQQATKFTTYLFVVAFAGIPLPHRTEPYCNILQPTEQNLAWSPFFGFSSTFTQSVVVDLNQHNSSNSTTTIPQGATHRLTTMPTTS